MTLNKNLTWLYQAYLDPVQYMTKLDKTHIYI